MAPELQIQWLGSVPYPEALELQQKAVEARGHGAIPDTLLLLEHPSVITLGRGSTRENILATSPV